MMEGVGARVRLWVAIWAGGAGVLACSPSSTAPEPGAIARGDALFHDRKLAGLGANGRAYSDCHVDTAGFGLTPARVGAHVQSINSSGIE